MEILIAIAIVAGFALVAAAIARRPAGPTADSDESRAAQLAQQEAILKRAADEAAARNSEAFLKLAQERFKQETARGEEQLKARHGEIDRGLENIRKELLQVREYVAKTDNEQTKGIANLAAITRESKQVTDALRQDTSKLNETLAGGQARGQWGERMAEDVLRVAGFIENINYRKQSNLDEGGRPDFTFLLPEERVLHMDVKFPLASYKRYLDAENDSERERTCKDFLRDVKQRITEVTTRDYIDPANGTLDYTLVFIPNEQVYGFIQEQDQSMLEFALEKRVVICSPLTLFAILAVIRQSVDNFKLAERTDEILSVLGNFNKQWDSYKKKMENLGDAINRTQKVYGELTTTRTNQLDRQVRKVEALRQADDDVLDVDAELREITEGDETPSVEATVPDTEKPLF